MHDSHVILNYPSDIPEDAEAVALPYSPRWYQMDFEAAMFGGKKRALLVWHRRAGKDIATLNFMVNEALKRVGVYYYFLPTHKQARKVIWDSIDESGKPLLSCIPDQIIDGKPHQTEMKIRLINGSLIQFIGTDNCDSIAGTNPCGVVFSEYSLQDPTIWQLIVSPILVKNGGWAVFNGTPRGKNHQYDLDCVARENPHSWFYQKLTVDDTGLITSEQIDQERREGKSEEIIQQEWYCSYNRGMEGSYYGRLVERARLEDRIGRIRYEPRSVVNTNWDIGYGDSTFIIWWQVCAGELRILECYEAHGEGLAHYIKVINAKEYVYGTHYLPHDAAAGSIQTGMSLSQKASELGLKHIILDRYSFESGIEAGRSTLAVAYIDEIHCMQLIKCLESYHKKFNDRMGVYMDVAVHDWASHGADCWRYVGLTHTRFGGTSSKLSSERINEMRQKHQGY